MTAPAPFKQAVAMPLSVPQLAHRWGCSEGLIRKMIRDGGLQCFRPGALIRISAAEVERFECQQHQNTPSSGLEEPMPSSGARMASADDASSPRKIGRAPKRKPEQSGNVATIHHGPWGES